MAKCSDDEILFSKMSVGIWSRLNMQCLWNQGERERFLVMMNSAAQCLLIRSLFLLVSIIWALDSFICTGKKRISETFISSQEGLHKNSTLLSSFDLCKLKPIHMEVLKGNSRVVWWWKVWYFTTSSAGNSPSVFWSVRWHVKSFGGCLACGKHTEATVMMLGYKDTEGDKRGTWELMLT